MAKTIELCGGKYLYLSDYNRVINAEVKDFFLANERNQKITVSDIDITEDLLQRKFLDLPMTIFEVTENCNLRCKYCIFNDNYQHYRSINPREMTFETAVKGINYIFSKIKNRSDKKFNFGFYGGEPLLNLKLIRQIIEYTKETFKEWELFYNLTSNLTALTDSALDFLIEHNISLSISLDGDQANHDAKRVFADGTGTHETVLKNLQRILDRHQEYFEKKISFMAVHSYDLPLENLLEFFKNNPLVQGKSTRFNTVTAYGTDYYKLNPFDVEKKLTEFDKTHDRIAWKKRMGKRLSPVEESLDRQISAATDFLKKRSLSTLAQTCLFDSRLFLDTQGRFHACERMNNTMSIGDVENGLDFPKMVDLLKKFQQIIKETCSDCEVKFMCGRCFKPVASEGTFAIPDNYCKYQKRGNIRNLERNIEYREQGLTKKTNTNKVKRFHQFVRVERGPKNAAIIDFLTGNLFQVPVEVIDKFNSGNYREIDEFMQVVQDEKLIIEIDPANWIPAVEFEREIGKNEIYDTGIELHVAEGVDLEPALGKFRGYSINKIYYYGEALPDIGPYKEKIELAQINFEECLSRATIQGKFPRTREALVRFNSRYNSCRGTVIAITADGKIRPCIHSRIELGDISRDLDNVEDVIDKFEPYWTFTKDKVEKCKDCELRYICFDCREIAIRQNNCQNSPNPLCKYNPYTGEWGT